MGFVKCSEEWGGGIIPQWRLQGNSSSQTCCYECGHVGQGELKRDTGCGAEDWVVFLPTGEHFLWWGPNLCCVKALKSERLSYFPQHYRRQALIWAILPARSTVLSTPPQAHLVTSTPSLGQLSLLRALYGSFIPQTSLLPFYRMS